MSEGIIFRFYPDGIVADQCIFIDDHDTIVLRLAIGKLSLGSFLRGSDLFDSLLI